VCSPQETLWIDVLFVIRNETGQPVTRRRRALVFNEEHPGEEIALG
jgi:hypothetical protein